MIKKNSISIFLILAASIIGFYTYKKYRIAPRISFPKLEVLSEKNEIIKFLPKKNKLTVVTFYASWCPDCKIEFPKMQSASETDFVNIDFIAITDEGVEKMISFQKKNNYPFTFYSLPKSFDAYDIYAIPTTYILTANYEILYSKVGEVNWKEEQFILGIQKFQKENE